MSRAWLVVYTVAGVLTVGLHARLAGHETAGTDAAVFLAHFGVGFLIYLVALVAGRRLGGISTVAVVLWCVAVSAGSMAPYLRADLLLSTEVHRYQWDGRVAEAGFNPYEVSPNHSDVAPLREAFPHPVPNPDQKGLYPPLAELLFYGMARLGTESLLHYRAVFSVTALLCGLALLPLCRGAGVPATRLTVFLWHPLLILETAANAHIDTAALLLLVLSLSLLIHRHHLTPLGSLGLAVLMRAVPLTIFPLYLRRIPFYRIVLFFLILLAGSLPFIAAGRELVTGFASYLENARFNPGLYQLAERGFALMGFPGWTRPVVGLLGLGAILGLYATDDGSNRSILRRAFYLTLPPLLLGPVIKPAYLLWLLPFLALVPVTNPYRMAFLYLSGSVALSYVHLDWGYIPGWISWMEFSPVAVLAVLGLWRSKRSRNAAPGGEHPVAAGAGPGEA